MIRPIYVLLDGRATRQFDGITVPTDAVAVEAAHTYLHRSSRTSTSTVM